MPTQTAPKEPTFPPRSSGRTAVPATQAEEPWGESDIKGVLGRGKPPRPRPRQKGDLFFPLRKPPGYARFGEEQEIQVEVCVCVCVVIYLVDFGWVNFWGNLVKCVEKCEKVAAFFFWKAAFFGR